MGNIQNCMKDKSGDVINQNCSEANGMLIFYFILLNVYLSFLQLKKKARQLICESETWVIQSWNDGIQWVTELIQRGCEVLISAFCSLLISCHHSCGAQQNSGSGGTSANTIPDLFKLAGREELGQLLGWRELLQEKSDLLALILLSCGFFPAQKWGAATLTKVRHFAHSIVLEYIVFILCFPTSGY